MDASPSSSNARTSVTQRAQNEFAKENYEECVNLLNSLDTGDGLNLKLKHNRIIAEFFKNGLRSAHEVLKKFDAMIKDPTVIKPELMYLHYNYAVILFHKHQYKKALKILRPLQRLLNANHQLDETLRGYINLMIISILGQSDFHTGGEMLTCDYFPAGKKYFAGETNGNRQWEFKEMWALVAQRIFVKTMETPKPPHAKPDNCEFAIHRAHHHYLRNEIESAAKELSKKFVNEPFTMAKNGEIQDTAIANNMGLIHFAVRHYAMAVQFFQCALDFDNEASESVLKDGPIHEMSAYRRPEILYNLGVSMLFLERPQEAFDSLLVALNYYHNNPRLWLRLAEACIMVHKANVKNKTNTNLITAAVIGSGMLRKFVLKPTIFKYQTSFSDSYAIPNPNLEFATLCLSNALTLIKNMEEALKKKRLKRVVSPPSSPMDPSMVEKIKHTILVNLSYSLIHLGEFKLAMKYAEELVEEPNCPATLKFITNMYIAECMLILDKIDVTTIFRHVNPLMFTRITKEDFERHPSPGWTCNNRDVAKSIQQYNAAVCMIMVNESGHNNASRLLELGFHSDIMDQVKKLKVYLDNYVKGTENSTLLEENKDS